MIDPKNIVRYNYTDSELEELAIFSICVAGKTARTIAPRVDRLLKQPGGINPFLRYQLKTVGIGCYAGKAHAIRELLAKKFDLKTCTVEDLEKIKGIGPKTSRFIVMSSRYNAQHAAIDTHIQKYLKELGYEVPKSLSKKKYLELEKVFLSLVPEGMTPAEFDREIWLYYAENVGEFPEPKYNYKEQKC